MDAALRDLVRSRAGSMVSLLPSNEIQLRRLPVPLRGRVKPPGINSAKPTTRNLDVRWSLSGVRYA
jgi:hypothetical protein